MQRKIFLLILILGLNCILGCATFRYPPIEKELVSMWIHRNQVDAIKNTILNEGYKITSKEDYLYEGAICTNYAKNILTDKVNTDIQILLNFKNTEVPKDYYRNLGITILNLGHANISEVNKEIGRMEKILYEKLLEVTDKEYVKRGDKEIYGHKKNIFEYYSKRRGKPVPKLAIWDRNAVKKKLNTAWIPRNQVSTVKSTILAEGYQRSGEEDVYYDDDSFVTEYVKEMPTAKKKSNIQIKLAFKESYSPKDYYRDLSITILNFGKELPEINTEIDRIEAILYQRLIEISGKDRVQRGVK